MAGDALGPWWVGIGAGIVTTLLGTIGKLWAELASVRRDARAQLEQRDTELAEANQLIVQLQREATERGDAHQREHVRDLRRMVGLSTSVDPPPMNAAYPPVVVRTAPVQTRRTPKKKP